MMLQKMEQDQGFDVGNNFKLRMKLNRVENEDPNILIHKRQVQSMTEEIEACEMEIKRIEALNKDSLMVKENKILEIRNYCKRVMIDIHNNMDPVQDVPAIDRLQDMRSLDHESGLYIDVLSDEHKLVEDNLGRVKETNLLLRVKLDKQKLQLNALKREILAEEEKMDKRDYEHDKLRRYMGKDGSDLSDEDDMYDDQATIARKRDRKIKKQIKYSQRK